MVEGGLRTVGDRCGTISVSGTSKYDGVCEVWFDGESAVCIDTGRIEASLLRQLTPCQLCVNHVEVGYRRTPPSSIELSLSELSFVSHM